MKNIILQHFTGNLRELDKRSIENIKQYATFIGADYKLILGQVFRSHLTPPCQKVFLLDKKFDDYDNVLMLDIDMFVPSSMNENIFETEGIGLYEEVQKRLHSRLATIYKNIANLNYPYWGGAIYKMDRDTRMLLRNGLGGDESWMNYFNKPYHYEDEGIMHVLATKAKFKSVKPYLDKKWCQCSFLPNPEKAGFIHMRTKITPVGPKREKIENYNELVDRGILK